MTRVPAAPAPAQDAHRRAVARGKLRNERSHLRAGIRSGATLDRVADLRRINEITRELGESGE